MRMPFQRVESRIASNHSRPYPVLGHPTLGFMGLHNQHGAVACAGI